MMDRTVELTVQLVNCISVTPEEGGCIEILRSRLERIGFTCEVETYNDVTNLYARMGEDLENSICFGGHIDVVPSGDVELWTSDPFKATIRNGRLYGRGSSDMKGGVAAFLVAVEDFVESEEFLIRRPLIALIITSDEEGVALFGTKRVVEKLKERSMRFKYCIVGEPSSESRFGDVIRNGRRGSLGATLRIIGKQGHIAYPHKARNPIFDLSAILHEMNQIHWDEGNQFFPPTSFQVSNLSSGTGALNVIPSDAVAKFNFRFTNEVSVDQLKIRTLGIVEKYAQNYEIEWTADNAISLPFLTSGGKLCEVASKVIKECVNVDTVFSTGGGTSDGRFLRLICDELIELGTENETIHQIDENVKIDSLTNLQKVYLSILKKLFPT